MSATLQFPQRERLSAVDSAKLLRQALKTHFPATKFSVTLDRGTAYGCASVRWTDGPTVRLVDTIVDPFSGEGFDGSIDCAYHIDTNIANGQRSGLRLISTSREISYCLAVKAAAKVADYFGVPTPTITDCGHYWRVENDKHMVGAFNEYWSTMIHRAASDASQYNRD